MISLRKLREEHEILQKDIAAALGISRAAYSNYETGLRNPDIDMLKQIADYFIVSIDDLLDYVPKSNDQFILKHDDKLLIQKYHALSNDGKKRILHQLEFELELDAQKKNLKLI